LRLSDFKASPGLNLKLSLLIVSILFKYYNINILII
jgi:hypothetical protein